MHIAKNRSQINNLPLYLKKLVNQGQMKSKLSRGSDTSKWQALKIHKNKGTKNLSFEKINKIVKPLTRLTKKQNSNTKNQKRKWKDYELHREMQKILPL